jgi:hypothetical protein
MSDNLKALVLDEESYGLRVPPHQPLILAAKFVLPSKEAEPIHAYRAARQDAARDRVRQELRKWADTELATARRLRGQLAAAKAEEAKQTEELAVANREYDEANLVNDLKRRAAADRRIAAAEAAVATQARCVKRTEQQALAEEERVRAECGRVYDLVLNQFAKAARERRAAAKDALVRAVAGVLNELSVAEAEWNTLDGPDEGLTSAFAESRRGQAANWAGLPRPAAANP